ncbi:MAG: hypothetical protein ACOZNI_37275 [Myxococcota bacterium]
MSLPSPAPSLAPDPLRRLWGPVTVRVAWDLVRAGVAVRPQLLRAVREHALWRIPAAAGLAEAEAIASQAVEDFLARAAGRYAPWAPDPDLAILPDPRWRDAVSEQADPVHEAVLRLHYADGLPLEEVERRTRLDAALLRAAREAVREHVRAVVADDGVSLDGWDGARVDRLVARIATAAGDLCPGPGGLATEPGRAHAERCPRCSRALRLLREGLLSPSDLFHPEDGRCLPTATVDLLCLLAHPDARRHTRMLARAFGDAARLVGEDTLFVDAGARPDAETLLRDAAERKSPANAHLRAVRRVVPARWHKLAVLGPGPEALLAEANSLAWGDTVGLEPLPDPLPPPPSAARWWAGAALVALLATGAALWTLLPGPPAALVPLTAAREPGAVVFDTEDTAYVDVLARTPSGLEVVFHSDAAGDKGALGTGDGRYRFATDAPVVLVVASPAPLDDMERVAAGLAGAEPETLVERLRERYTGAAVASLP